MSREVTSRMVQRQGGVSWLNAKGKGVLMKTLFLLVTFSTGLNLQCNQNTLKEGRKGTRGFKFYTFTNSCDCEFGDCKGCCRRSVWSVIAVWARSWNLPSLRKSRAVRRTWSTSRSKLGVSSSDFGLWTGAKAKKRAPLHSDTYWCLLYKKISKSKSFKKSKVKNVTQFDFYEAGKCWIAVHTRYKFTLVRMVLKPEHVVMKSERVVLKSEHELSFPQPTGRKGNSTFVQKFIVLQRGYHHARRLNKLNKKSHK